MSDMADIAAILAVYLVGVEAANNLQAIISLLKVNLHEYQIKKPHKSLICRA
jgi:hypothetical protein